MKEDLRRFYGGRRVVVTGGSGFIGSHVVACLSACAARIRVPARSPASAAAALGSSVEIVPCDLTSPGAAEEAIAGAEIVFHLAGRVGGVGLNQLHPATMFRENMRLFLPVIEACRLHHVDLLVAVSSACVYPRDCRIPTPEEEGTRGSPDPSNEGYGWAKRMLEYLSQAYSREYHMRIAIPRPYNAYGPRDHFDLESGHVIPALVRKFLDPSVKQVRVWGDGRQSRSFLYAEDFAEGVLRCGMSYATAEPLNIGSDEEISIADLAFLVRELTGSTKEVVFDPSAPAGQPRRRCDVTRMMRVLGWKPRISLREGLRRTIEWYRAHGSTLAAAPRA